MIEYSDTYGTVKVKGIKKNTSHIASYNVKVNFEKGKESITFNESLASWIIDNMRAFVEISLTVRECVETIYEDVKLTSWNQTKKTEIKIDDSLLTPEIISNNEKVRLYLEREENDLP